MRSLEDIIIKLPSNSSTLIEHRIKLNSVTLMVIKDDFNMIKAETINPKIAIRGAFIKNNGILAQYIMVSVREKAFSNYYRFYFDYNDKRSLKLLLNLVKQKNIYIVLCHNNCEFIKEVSLENTMKNFFKDYVERCLKMTCKWKSKDLKKIFEKMNDTYSEDQALWRDLGTDIVKN